MLHLLCWGIDNQCAQLPPPCVCTCECSLGLCRVVVCRCTKRLFSNCRVQDSLCKAATSERNENLFSSCRVQDSLCKVDTNERNENLFSNCRVQDNLCKVDTNERNENLFSNCRVQDNLCKVTTFFSLFRVTFCLCCFLALYAFVFCFLKRFADYNMTAFCMQQATGELLLYFVVLNNSWNRFVCHFIAKRTYFYQATNIYWQTPKMYACRRCFLWDCATCGIFLTTRHKPFANNWQSMELCFYSIRLVPTKMEPCSMWHGIGEQISWNRSTDKMEWRSILAITKSLAKNSKTRT